MRDPDVSRAAEIAARGVCRGGGEGRVPIVRRAGRQKAQFLLDRGQGAAITGDVVDIPHRIVPADAVASADAREGVIAPPILCLPAEGAKRVIMPDRHAPATKGGEEGRGEVGVGRVREGREPRAGTRVAVES